MDEEGALNIERRITKRVYDYWCGLCRGRDMPEESDIDPDVLGEDWPYCYLLQTRDIDHIEQFNFTYLGEGISNAYHRAGIDPGNLELIGPNAFYLAHRFKQVVKTREPIIESNHLFAYDGTKIFYRQCLLPVGTHHKVEAIFGAVQFKIEGK